jgi:hypothetical protein
MDDEIACSRSRHLLSAIVLVTTDDVRTKSMTLQKSFLVCTSSVFSINSTFTYTIF